MTRDAPWEEEVDFYEGCDGVELVAGEEKLPVTKHGMWARNRAIRSGRLKIKAAIVDEIEKAVEAPAAEPAVEAPVAEPATEEPAPETTPPED